MKENLNQQFLLRCLKNCFCVQALKFNGNDFLLPLIFTIEKQFNKSIQLRKNQVKLVY